MAEPERFFFVHLQKTGGTALFQRLLEHFDPAEVYPTPEDRGMVAAVLDVDHLIDRYREHRHELRVVTGHFPVCTVDLLDGRFTTFTLLRHPVERTLSLLRRRQAVDDRFHGLALEEIYEDAALQDIIHNHMVKMLSLTAAEMGSTPLTLPVDFDDERLATARGNLEDIDVVGLQERFDDACAELEARFGWDLGAARFANRTTAQVVSGELRERIAVDNRLDMELYRFAVELVDSRRATEAGRG